MNPDETVQNLLKHYGVKGMRWGVRRKNVGTPTEVVVKVDPTKTRKKITTSGGENQPAHKDAIAARTTQQILRKSGQDALSNQQLQDLQTRLNLEQNVARLDANHREAGQHFLVKFLKSPAGQKQVKEAANSPAAQSVKKKVMTKLAIGAVAAA